MHMYVYIYIYIYNYLHTHAKRDARGAPFARHGKASKKLHETQEITTCAAEQSLMFCDLLKHIAGPGSLAPILY